MQLLLRQGCMRANIQYRGCSNTASEEIKNCEGPLKINYIRKLDQKSGEGWGGVIADGGSNGSTVLGWPGGLLPQKRSTTLCTIVSAIAAPPPLALVSL
jgi:hypothetical protein